MRFCLLEQVKFLSLEPVVALVIPCACHPVLWFVVSYKCSIWTTFKGVICFMVVHPDAANAVLRDLLYLCVGSSLRLCTSS
jgi:hypothetical protein